MECKHVTNPTLPRTHTRAEIETYLAQQLVALLALIDQLIAEQRHFLPHRLHVPYGSIALLHGAYHRLLVVFQRALDVGVVMAQGANKVLQPQQFRTERTGQKASNKPTRVGLVNKR